MTAGPMHNCVHDGLHHRRWYVDDVDDSLTLIYFTLCTQPGPGMSSQMTGWKVRV